MYTLIEKARCVLVYAETKSITVTRRRNPPTRKSILTWVQQFTESGKLGRKTRTPKNAQDNMLNDIIEVREILALNNNRISVRKISQITQFSKSKVHRLLKIIKFKAYKIQSFQKNRASFNRTKIFHVRNIVGSGVVCPKLKFTAFFFFMKQQLTETLTPTCWRSFFIPNYNKMKL